MLRTFRFTKNIINKTSYFIKNFHQSTSKPFTPLVQQKRLYNKYWSIGVISVSIIGGYFLVVSGVVCIAVLVIVLPIMSIINTIENREDIFVNSVNEKGIIKHKRMKFKQQIYDKIFHPILFLLFFPFYIMFYPLLILGCYEVEEVEEEIKI